MKNKNISFFLVSRFLYAFHNKDFRNAFQKTLSKYIICCRERRTSTSSSIPLPPATPSGENHRSNSNKQKAAKNKKTKDRSKTNLNEQQIIHTNKLTRGNNGLETSNGNLTAGENSASSKHNSCL
jgi:hypothetical protein